jgi:hypothetical protein
MTMSLEVDVIPVSELVHAQIATALTGALGHEVTFTDVPPEAFAASIQDLLPPWQVDGLLEAPHSVDQFASDYAATFAGQRRK